MVEIVNLRGSEKEQTHPLTPPSVFPLWGTEGGLERISPPSRSPQGERGGEQSLAVRKAVDSLSPFKGE